MPTSPPIKALVTGAAGQLGEALLKSAPVAIQAVGVNRTECDICDASSVAVALDQHRPNFLINAAAYTAVDRAEEEPQLALAANAEAVAVLAEACRERKIRLLHVSTDFVFDGKESRPYTPDAVTAPLGVYGQSKLAGEQALQDSGAAYLILRTGWVYSHRPGNFMTTMLRLHDEREAINVVADQVGTPTRAESLAAALWSAAMRPELSGIYHFSDAGVASWYDFAHAIGEQAHREGLLDSAADVVPIRSEDYPTAASRPAYSVLDKTACWRDFAIQPEHWRDGLRRALQALSEGT